MLTNNILSNSNATLTSNLYTILANIEDDNNNLKKSIKLPIDSINPKDNNKDDNLPIL